MNKIAIDIGGTFMRVALFKNNAIIKMVKEQTPKTKEAFIKQLIELIYEVKDNQKINGIGVGIPGPADYEKGIIFNPTNLPLRNVNLKKILQNKFKTKIAFENDACCVALAEKNFGVKRKNFLVLTLGTGIGGGIVIDNKLYKGEGTAGEIGHMILQYMPYKREHHEINNPGSFEILASGEAMRQMSKVQYKKSLSAKQLKDLARQGDKKAEKILDETTLYLAMGISNLIYIFNPEIIVLSGGVKEAGDYFLDKIKTKMIMFNPIKTKIIWTRMEEPGLIGALTLV